jgi:cytochrome c oxidase cbb3-type subunit 3
MSTDSQTHHTASDEERDPTIDYHLLRDHTFDGIQEYDQHLPNWWLFTLYIAIAFFVGYWVVYYQFDGLFTDSEKLEFRMNAIAEKEEARLAKMDLNDATLWNMSQNPAVVDAGESIFTTNCVACHGTDLSANLNGIPLPGLPLNDSEWKYGATPMEIMKVVTDGSPDITKGMIAWKDPLGGMDKVAKVVAFVLSHHTAPETGAEE